MASNSMSVPGCTFRLNSTDLNVSIEILQRKVGSKSEVEEMIARGEALCQIFARQLHNTFLAPTSGSFNAVFFPAERDGEPTLVSRPRGLYISDKGIQVRIEAKVEDIDLKPLCSSTECAIEEQLCVPLEEAQIKEMGRQFFQALSLMHEQGQSCTPSAKINIANVITTSGLKTFYLNGVMAQVQWEVPGDAITESGLQLAPNSPETYSQEVNASPTAKDVWEMAALLLEARFGMRLFKVVNSYLVEEGSNQIKLFEVISNFETGQALEFFLTQLREIQSSDACIDFFRQALCTDPVKRASAKELLNHRFLMS